jgi:hypothetical protein
MGFPSEKIEGIYRNNLNDVYRFMEARHPTRYRIYNLCSERGYDPAKFHNRVAVYPFDDHNPPPIGMMEAFCMDAVSWLAADPKHIVAIHCKAGKGRTGVMISCLLMHIASLNGARLKSSDPVQRSKVIDLGIKQDDEFFEDVGDEDDNDDDDDDEDDDHDEDDDGSIIVEANLEDVDISGAGFQKRRSFASWSRNKVDNSISRNAVVKRKLDLRLAKDALWFYGMKRTSNGKGVTIPSQSRYVYYYEQILKEYIVPFVSSSSSIHSNSISPHVHSNSSSSSASSSPHIHQISPSYLQPKTMLLKQLSVSPGTCKISTVVIRIKNSIVFRGPARLSLTGDLDFVSMVSSAQGCGIPLCGDVRFELFSGPGEKKKIAHFWLNTHFIPRHPKGTPDRTHGLHLSKSDIDGAVKDSKNKLFEPSFKIYLAFIDPMEDTEGDINVKVNGGINGQVNGVDESDPRTISPTLDDLIL